MKNLDLLAKFRKKYCSLQATEPYPYTKKILFSNVCNLLYYKGRGHEVFLIVPSIFNSHEILTLGSPLDIITALRQRGKVFLVEWLEIKDKNFGLNDYAHETAKVLEQFKKVHLIGHCLGGNLALAASVLKQEVIESLILLTMPWDFSHFAAPKALYNVMGLAKAVEGQDYIPSIFMQILFFLLSPESFEQKLDFYHANKKNVDSSNFFDVERWQFSGHSITRKTYDDLMKKFIDDNILVKNLWSVADNIIDPTKLKMPIMMVTCLKDRLVPKNSGTTLHYLAEVFEYNCGHIGYLVGSQRGKFLKDLLEWIS